MGPDRTERLSCLLQRVLLVRKNGQALGLHRADIAKRAGVAFDRAALVLFLGPESPAVALARHIQFLASWSFIIFGVTIVLFGTMRAGGVVYAPLIVLGIALFPARLGFYYALVGTLGQDALWLSFPFGSFVGVALAIVAYRRKGWRLKARAISPERAAEEVNTNGEAVGRFKPDM